MERQKLVLVLRSMLFREGLKLLLRDSPFEVAAVASCYTEIDTAHAPALVIAEANAGADRADPCAEVRAFRARCPEVGLVLLCEKLRVQEVVAAFRAGADAYLMKDISPSALVHSLWLVLEGTKVLPSGLVDHLVDDDAPLVDPSALLARTELDKRDEQLLEQLIKGHSNKLIAKRLGIAEGTVKMQLKALLRKIAVQNRTQAAVWAMQHGINGAAQGKLEPEARPRPTTEQHYAL